jgi:FixJ family two-component response regulator
VNSGAPLVYLVDDDPAVLRGFSRLLQAWGYRTRTFGTAQELLDDDVRETPDCLVLDVHMPGLSGVELQAHLTLRNRLSPIVFLTGHLDLTVRAHAVASGAVDFLQKPIGDQDLLRAVQRAVDRGRGIVHAGR